MINYQSPTISLGTDVAFNLRLRLKGQTITVYNDGQTATREMEPEDLDLSQAQDLSVVLSPRMSRREIIPPPLSGRRATASRGVLCPTATIGMQSYRSNPPTERRMRSFGLRSMMPSLGTRGLLFHSGIQTKSIGNKIVIGNLM